MLREHGTAWKRIASELHNRTPAMVAALYERHRGYLNLSSELTNAKVPRAPRLDLFSCAA